MSPDEPPSGWDSTAPDPDRLPETAALSPIDRGDSIIATWGLLTLGHIIEGCFGMWALIWGDLWGRGDEPTAPVAAVILITVFGWAGMILSIWMLRGTLRVRLAIERDSPPRPTSPPPTALAAWYTFGVVCTGVLAIVLWQALGILPAVGIEFIVIPLAMRTERFIGDVARDTEGR